jgi:hypothetical protein
MQNFDPQKDYYDILGVDEQASNEEIERAFRHEARKHHPDAGGSEETMKALNEARDLLSDDETRQAYDLARAPKTIIYGSSYAFDADAAVRGDAFETVSDDEGFTGSAMLAATSLGIGIPLLFLVETQWVFFLWPLRIGAVGMVLFGIWMAQAALSAKHRKIKKSQVKFSTSRLILNQLLFWAFTILICGILVVGLYYR